MQLCFSAFLCTQMSPQGLQKPYVSYERRQEARKLQHKYGIYKYRKKEVVPFFGESKEADCIWIPLYVVCLFFIFFAFFQVQREQLQAFYKQCRDVMRRCMPLAEPMEAIASSGTSRTASGKPDKKKSKRAAGQKSRRD